MQGLVGLDDNYMDAYLEWMRMASGAESEIKVLWVTVIAQDDEYMEIGSTICLCFIEGDIIKPVFSFGYTTQTIQDVSRFVIVHPITGKAMAFSPELTVFNGVTFIEDAEFVEI